MNKDEIIAELPEWWYRKDGTPMYATELADRIVNDIVDNAVNIAGHWYHPLTDREAITTVLGG